MLFQKRGTTYKVAEKVGSLKTENDHATKKQNTKVEEKKTLSKTIMYHGTEYTKSI